MTPERWAQIEALFHRAAECDPERRTSLLDEVCRNDPDLRREVEALLSSDRSATGHLKAAVRESVDAFNFPLVGEVVSHYRILNALSGGGMGLVYRAEDLKLGRQVAIKFLPEESARDSAALARFEREARSASALEHPNICPVYEFGEHEGQPFLVMQLLEGPTLRELIFAAEFREPPLPVDKVIDIAFQIADALEAAHNKGIIHRDIKPANIFITNEGQAKILDFGLAKLTRTGQEEVDESGRDHGDGGSKRITRETAPLTLEDPLLSRTGIAMGTAGYMSPEQVRGEKLDARTDLFSFGLVLYEMATGKRAFAGDTEPVLHSAILDQNPASVRVLSPKLPVRFERIINKALEKDRVRRYQAVTELRADLEILKHEIEPSTLTPRWMLAFAAIIVLSTAGAMFWFARYRPTSSQTLPDVKLRQLTANSSENPVKGGAISPDGKYLAYVDGRGLHVKKLETDEAQSVPAPEGLKPSDVNWEVIPTNWFPDSKRFLGKHASGEPGESF